MPADFLKNGFFMVFSRTRFEIASTTAAMRAGGVPALHTEIRAAAAYRLSQRVPAQLQGTLAHWVCRQFVFFDVTYSRMKDDAVAFALMTAGLPRWVIMPLERMGKPGRVIAKALWRCKLNVRGWQALVGLIVESRRAQKH